MLQSAYYESDLAAFCQASENEVLGELTAQHHFALENQQRHAWQQQISILKASLIGVAAGRVKVSGPRGRAKHLQPLNAVALADGGNAGAVLGDGGVHWAKCTGGVFRAPAT